MQADYPGDAGNNDSLDYASAHICDQLLECSEAGLGMLSVSESCSVIPRIRCWLSDLTLDP